MFATYVAISNSKKTKKTTPYITVLNIAKVYCTKFLGSFFTQYLK